MLTRAAVALAAALFAAPIAARTDLEGCVSSATVAYGGASLIWYVPGTGEICDFLDCGGGRAPPKTTVPGCDAYHGTATYSPSYLPGFGSESLASSTSTAAPDSTATTTTDLETTSVAATTADTTVLTGTATNTITSAATISTSTSGSASKATTSTTASTVGTASSNSVSSAAGVMATAGPLGMLAGLAVGAVAVF